MKNEREVVEYIESLAGLGIVPGLDGIGELCARLGNPQKDLKCIHVAGTNGKGSVCAFLDSIYRTAGYRVGRYLSPTLNSYRERIQANGKNISVRALCEGMENVKAACDQMTAEGFSHPTPFEMETALAFCYFQEKKCDIIILETGMGGALDATNLIEAPIASVITSISMDHMKFLGNSLEEIAAQKAGILKAACPAICAAQREEVTRVIETKAKELSCPIHFLDTENIRHVKYGLKKQEFDYGSLKKLRITLAGKYQIENAALAVEVVATLSQRGFAVSEEKLRTGLLAAKWPGRFEILGEKPLFLVDGAHNEDAARRLAESMDAYFSGKRIIFIMGMFRDKEVEKVIALTHSYADQIITVQTPGNPRALPAFELAQKIHEVHEKVTAVDSLEEAVEMALLLAGKDDCIIAFGSLSFLGALTEIYKRKRTQRW